MLSNKLREWLGPEAKLEPTGDLRHGDYTTNLALVLKRDANELVAELKKTQPAEIADVKAEGPGFINFWLAPAVLAAAVNQAVGESGEWGRGQAQAGQKVLVEYTDPNPFKEFHLGHLMSNAIGEALSRLIAAEGAEVKRACYQGDVGLHVAKAIWGIINKKANPYAAGAQAYESDAAAKQEIGEINKKVYERSDAVINKIYDEGRAASLAAFEVIYKKLGTKFDDYFFESQTGPLGQEIVEAELGKVFEKSEGATVFPGEKFGLHTRVFLSSTGLPTYEAKELGLTKLKAEHFPDLSKSVVITGNEVNAYFDVVLKAMGEISELKPLAAKTIHIGHGMLRLPSGKMSSRTGDVITAEAIIEQLAGAVGERNDALDQAAREQIAIGALKYQILKQAPGRDVIFDQAKALSLEGDSGPYLQYAVVRARSVLAKVPTKGYSLTTNHSPHPLARQLLHFPEVVARAAAELAPQLLTTYLTNLAAAFNHFYATERIIGGEQEADYLALTAAVAQTLQNGLILLGISVPERM